jgi:protein TonB
MFRPAKASDARAFGLLVSLAVHVGALAAWGLLSLSPGIAPVPNRGDKPLAVTIVPLSVIASGKPPAVWPETAVAFTGPAGHPDTGAAAPVLPVPALPGRSDAAAPPVVSSALPASAPVETLLSRPAASLPADGERAAYVRRLWKWIAARRPEGIHLAGEALISFSIGSDGSLLGLSLDRPSGRAQLDRLALRTVRLAAPFPRPPENLGTGRLDFTLPFHFD